MPGAARTREGVGEGDKLGHDGDDGCLGLLAALTEATVG